MTFQEFREQVSQEADDEQFYRQHIKEEKSYPFAKDKSYSQVIATQKSIDVRPDHYDALVQLAVIQKHLDKKEAALKSIEKAISLMDQNDEEEISDKSVYQVYIDVLLLNNMEDKAKEIEKKIQ